MNENSRAKPYISKTLQKSLNLERKQFQQAITEQQPKRKSLTVRDTDVSDENITVTVTTEITTKDKDL